MSAYESPAISEQQRQKLAEDLKAYFAEVDANRKSVSAGEADEIVTEAIRSSRSGYRPRR